MSDNTVEGLSKALSALRKSRDWMVTEQMIRHYGPKFMGEVTEAISALEAITTAAPAPQLGELDELVKRLRNTPNWQRESYGSWKDCVLTYDRAPFEAADMLERLGSGVGVASEPHGEVVISTSLTGMDGVQVIQWAETAPPMFKGMRVWLTAPPIKPLPFAIQGFESKQAKTLAAAWKEGWEACRDAEFVGEEAENDAFNNSITQARCIDADQQPSPLAATPGADAPTGAKPERLQARVAELEALINTPELDSFLKAVHLEAVHQVERWGNAHDRAKRPADWFWLIGYLGGKALHSAIGGDTDKARHHCISTAAALYNWHSAISGHDTRMCPGSSDVAKIVDAAFPGTSSDGAGDGKPTVAKKEE